MNLEDNIRDVLAKAMRGTGVSRSALLAQCQLTSAQFDELLNGNSDLERWQSIAVVLGLNGAGLSRLATNELVPPKVRIPGLSSFSSSYPLPGHPSMQVNCHLIYDDARTGILIDTGADSAGLLAQIQERQINLEAIFITHAHHDHIAVLPEITAAWPSTTVWASAQEDVTRAKLVSDLDHLRVGQLSIQVLATPGHTEGGMSYFVQGLTRPVLATGDALFSGSAGGIASGYRQAIENLRKRVRNLPPETIVCPGHGPNSTIEFELSWNPFL